MESKKCTGKDFSPVEFFTLVEGNMGYQTSTAGTLSPLQKLFQAGIKKRAKRIAAEYGTHRMVKGTIVTNTQLGRGAYSTVYQGKDDSGRAVAVKVTQITRIEDTKTVKAEEYSLRVLSHKNIVRLYDSHAEATRAYLFLEKVEGQDLWRLIRSQRLTEHEVFHIFRQAVDAVEHCHANLFCHRDVKLENFILDDEGGLKLIDFGLAAHFDSPYSTECVGSPYYMSPEVINNMPHNPFLSDIWSLGVVLYHLATRKFPYPADTFDELKYIIDVGEVDYPSSMSEELADMIRGMLEKQPERRLSFDQIKQHPWAVAMLAETDVVEMREILPNA